jgi:transposase
MNYTEIIGETESQLQELENAQKLVQFQKRVRFLRLLKSGEAATQKQAGEIVGWKLRQSQQIWQLYRGQGLAGVWRKPERWHFGKLTSLQLAHLQRYLAEFGADSLSEAKALIEQMYGVRYTDSGVCVLFQRLRIKLKTARPSNTKKDEAAALTYKETLVS